jgi:hypothetical protein
MSRLPDSKSIFEKYGLSLEDLVRVRKRARKILKNIRRNKYRCKYFVSKPYSKNKRHNQNGFYRRYPKTHYYYREYIKLKYFKMKNKQSTVCWLCGNSRNLENHCPQGEYSKKNRGKASEIKAKQARERDESSKALTSVQCNQCGSDQHDTTSCLHNSFHIKREELHIMRDGCCSTSSETYEFEYDTDDLSELEQEALTITNNCRCEDP